MAFAARQLQRRAGQAAVCVLTSWARLQPVRRGVTYTASLQRDGTIEWQGVCPAGLRHHAPKCWRPLLRQLWGLAVETWHPPTSAFRPTALTCPTGPQQRSQHPKSHMLHTTGRPPSPFCGPALPAMHPPPQASPSRPPLPWASTSNGSSRPTSRATTAGRACSTAASHWTSSGVSTERCVFFPGVHTMIMRCSVMHTGASRSAFSGNSFWSRPNSGPHSFHR